MTGLPSVRESDLFLAYLKLGRDDVFSFAAYRRRCVITGIVVLEAGE